MITPIIVPTRSSPPQPDPQCPHCKTVLKGWSEPSEPLTFSDVMTTLTVLGIIALLFIGVLSGIAQGSYGQSPTKECEPYFSKRWHYLLPTNQITCRATMWLRNKSDDAQDRLDYFN